MEEVKVIKTKANPVQRLLWEVFGKEGKVDFKYSNGYTKDPDESTTVNPNGHPLNDRIVAVLTDPTINRDTNVFRLNIAHALFHLLSIIGTESLSSSINDLRLSVLMDLSSKEFSRKRAMQSMSRHAGVAYEIGEYDNKYQEISSLYAITRMIILLECYENLYQKILKSTKSEGKNSFFEDNFENLLVKYRKKIQNRVSELFQNGFDQVIKWETEVFDKYIGIQNWIHNKKNLEQLTEEDIDKINNEHSIAISKTRQEKDAFIKRYNNPEMDELTKFQTYFTNFLQTELDIFYKELNRAIKSNDWGDFNYLLENDEDFELADSQDIANKYFKIYNSN